MSRSSVAVAIVAVLAIWSLATPSDGDTRRQDETRRAGQERPPGSETERDRPERGRPERVRPESGQPTQTFVVTRVVDGDTVELGNGKHVRLVGMDTPEVGECGFERAAEVLASLVLDRQVVLVASDEDRDQYDRLLRYVDVGGVDSGLALIRRGLAIARYDSRDGYGFHPRERRYIAADRGTPSPVCAQPAPFAAVPPKAPKNCAPGYTPCVPPGPPDLDCADVNGPIRVSGADPHRLDGDGDGTACE